MYDEVILAERDHRYRRRDRSYAAFIPPDMARDIISFLLKENGIPAGDKELSSDISELADILITRPPSPPR
jgi:hypothetical protein